MKSYGDARAIVSRMIANREEYWELEDRLAGLVRIDNRKEKPTLGDTGT
jgi:hypothetical protein